MSIEVATRCVDEVIPNSEEKRIESSAASCKLQNPRPVFQRSLHVDEVISDSEVEIFTNRVVYSNSR